MDLSPGAVDPLIREVTLKRMKQALRFAKLLDASVVVFHSGYDKWRYDHKVEIWLEKSLLTWEEILKERGDLRIAVENIFEDTPDNLILLMEKLDTPEIGLCFDTGHFNLFSSVSLTEWLQPTLRYISEIHIHDNDRTRDLHMAPGKGNFNFQELFQMLKDSGSEDLVFTVEAHSLQDAIEAVRFLQNYRDLVYF